MHWLEDYAFGAVALREEMKRRKNDKSITKYFIRDVVLRLLYVYAITVVVLAAPYYLSIQIFNMLRFKFKEKFKKTN